MKFWEVVKAYQETGALSLRNGDSVFRNPAGHLFHYAHNNPQIVLDADYELEPQKIEVTLEMLENCWNKIVRNMEFAHYSSTFKAFAESLGFKCHSKN